MGQSNKLDLKYIVKVVTLLETLQNIFTEYDGNLGEKYARLPENLWSSEYLEKIRNY